MDLHRLRRATCSVHARAAVRSRSAQACNRRCKITPLRSALQSGFSPACRPRTHVRVGSVRPRPYRANTCSRQREHQPLRSARSMRLASPARSCCSRTTTTSTGRSTRTSGTNQSIRIGRGCAIGRSRSGLRVAGTASRGRRNNCASPPSDATTTCPRWRSNSDRSAWDARASQLALPAKIDRRRAATWAARAREKPAASYSPRPLRAKYHRR